MQKPKYLLTWICCISSCIALLSLWGCDKNDNPNNDNPADTTTIIENEVTFKINGGPNAVSGKTVIFGNFFLQETHAGIVDSINGTSLEAVALWNNSAAYLKILLPDTIAKFYKFEETFPPTYPDINKYIEIQVNGISPLQHLKFSNIKIEEYGPIGGRIRGTLNASFYDYTQNPQEPQTVNIVEGEFNFHRTQ